MLIGEFEQHLVSTGHVVESAKAGEGSYLVIRALPVSAGAHAGKTCDVAVLRSSSNPWVPEAAVHVRPHLVEMGKRSSQASPLGSDWQYLSRRFDKVATPKAFLAHILTVLAEL